MIENHFTLTPQLLQQLELWLHEDLGRGDLTAPALRNRCGQAHWIAGATGIFCGGVLVKPLFQLLDPAVDVKYEVADGSSIVVGQRLLTLFGEAAALAAGERTALNLAMRLSGIATTTSALVQQLSGTGVQLVDTRKTTPGLRTLEKYAVRCGGGGNHRMGLDDTAMLKENHLAWAGGISAAVTAVRHEAPWSVRLIVEAETASEARAAVLAGADGLLLDGFSPSQLRVLVPVLRRLASKRREGPIALEASGVDIVQLKAYSNTGVDLISSSAPTSRSSWLDLSMRFEKLGQHTGFTSGGNALSI